MLPHNISGFKISNHISENSHYSLVMKFGSNSVMGASKASNVNKEATMPTFGRRIDEENAYDDIKNVKYSQGEKIDNSIYDGISKDNVKDYMNLDAFKLNLEFTKVFYEEW